MDLCAIAGKVIRAWELGDEASYREHLDPQCRMKIEAYNLDVTGFDAIWAVRKSMSEGMDAPLDQHRQHSAHVLTGTRTVIALCDVVDKDGKAKQHSECTYHFSDEGNVVLYEQENFDSAPRVLAVFGATGNTGKYVVPLALDSGWRVKVLVRNPAKMASTDKSLIKVKGDLQDRGAITSVIQGASAVMWLAGHPRGTPLGYPGDSVMSEGLGLVCDAMEENKVRRLIVQVGGFTMLDGEAPPPWLIGCCVRDLYLGKHLGEMVALTDNQRIADMLQKRSRTIDWTLARPGMLKHGGSAQGSQPCIDVPGATETVKFVDLAKWELAMIEREEINHRGLFPGYAAAGNKGVLLFNTDGSKTERAPSTAAFFERLQSAAQDAAASRWSGARKGPELAWVLVDAKGVLLGSGHTDKASWQGGPAQLKVNALLATLRKGGAPDAWTKALVDPAKLTPFGAACGMCLVMGCCGCCVPAAVCGVSMPVAMCCTKKFYVKGGVVLTLPGAWAGDAVFAVAGANDANDDEKVATSALTACGLTYDPKTGRWTSKPAEPQAESMQRA